MIINCFYDENMEYADIVYIPDVICVDVEILYADFLKWIYDKCNNHKYWIIFNGEKVACNYGTSAFVEWINDNYMVQMMDKSYIIKKDSEMWDSRNRKLIF